MFFRKSEDYSVPVSVSLPAPMDPNTVLLVSGLRWYGPSEDKPPYVIEQRGERVLGFLDAVKVVNCGEKR